MTSPTDQQAYLLKSAAQTEALGAGLAGALGEFRAKNPGGLFRLYLQGPLGAGKTTLTRAVLHGLGVTGSVKSPSYTLVEQYRVAPEQLGHGPIAHFDFYRMNDPLEWEEAGFAETFVQSWLVIAEWPEKAHGVLPPADLLIEWQFDDDGESAELPRCVQFEYGSPSGVLVADAVKPLLAKP